MTTQNDHQMTTAQNIEYQNINPKNNGAVDKWTNLARLLKNKNEYAGTLFLSVHLTTKENLQQ